MMLLLMTFLIGVGAGLRTVTAPAASHEARCSCPPPARGVSGTVENSLHGLNSTSPLGTGRCEGEFSALRSTTRNP